jgi:hypothetical protein
MKKIAALTLAVAAAGLGLGGCAIVPYEPAVVMGPRVVYAPPPAVIVRPGYRQRDWRHDRYGWRG